jgi:hypothetical protein
VKLRILTVAASLALSGCAVPGLGRVSLDPPPAVQKIKAEASARLTDALAARLEHCTIIGNFDFKLALSADAGLSNTAGLNCVAKPWEAPAPTQVIPLRDIAKLPDPPT